MNDRKKKTLKIVLIVLGCLVIVAAVFCAGWFGGLYWGNSQFRSYQWVLGLIEDYYYGDFDDSVSENSAYALAAMLDQYSAYYSADEYAAYLADNEGSKSGIGVSYQYVDEDSYGEAGCLLVSVVGNSPAFYAGLKPGDIIVSATTGTGNTVENGGSGSTEGNSTGSTAGNSTGSTDGNSSTDGSGSAGDSASTTVFTSSSSFSSFVSSMDTGEPFTLTSSTGQTYTLARENYQASYTVMYTSTARWTFQTMEDDSSSVLYLVMDEDEDTDGDGITDVKYGMEELPDGTAYISLSEFYGTADQEFALLCREFSEAGCTSLILDLRSNGGGSVSIMQNIAGCFITESGSIAMTAEYKDGSTRSYGVGTSSYTFPEDTDVYVLANSGTASASEALIGALVSYDVLDYGSIYLSDYGQSYLDFTSSTKTARTYGKGIMQTTYVNSLTGEALKLTVARIYWPNGTCIHDVGITAADGCNTIQTPWVMTTGDTELSQAISMISASSYYSP